MKEKEFKAELEIVNLEDCQLKDVIGGIDIDAKGYGSSLSAYGGGGNDTLVIVGGHSTIVSGLECSLVGSSIRSN